MRGPNIMAHHSLERKVSAMMDCLAARGCHRHWDGTLCNAKMDDWNSPMSFSLHLWLLRCWWSALVACRSRPCSTNVVQHVQKISWVLFDASPLSRGGAFSSYGIELEEDEKLGEGLPVEVSEVVVDKPLLNENESGRGVDTLFTVKLPSFELESTCLLITTRGCEEIRKPRRVLDAESCRVDFDKGAVSCQTTWNS